MTGLEQQLEKNAKLKVRAVEFPEDLAWLNVSQPLEMSRLRGKVVLLDFWTFCCINCMHVLGELRRLEEKYPEELVVVGVHSPKFSNERDLENIRQSVARYEVKHPVVNDPGLVLWQSYGVRAWPTLVLIDPEGIVVLSVSGEGHYELLDQAVGFLVRKFERQRGLDRKPLPLAPEGERVPQSVLRYPGKVVADESGLVVADSNHNQILVADYSGAVLEVIASGRAGSLDGTFETAELNHPQGVVRAGTMIYVADTENHLIRTADLNRRTVATIAGTGSQGGTLRGRAPARATALNSPWDLVKAGERLYIAMAGAHQIWALDLRTDELDLVAGSGREDIEDGQGPHSALAQPSGLAFDANETLYFADSEVSAVRMVQLARGEVRTLIGRGLFHFGDQEGKFEDALLQHPLGVAYAQGIVYVADTYNDKIKVLDLKNRTISTLVGDGTEGFEDGSPGRLYEPGGLSVSGGKIYIADTNNHAVRVFDLAARRLETLSIRRNRAVQTGQAPKGWKNPFLETVKRPRETVAPDADVSVSVSLPERHEFTEGVALRFKASLEENQKVRILKEGELKLPERELPIRLKMGGPQARQALLEVALDIPYCTTEEPKLCKFKSLKLIQPVVVSASGKTKLDLHSQV